METYSRDGSIKSINWSLANVYCSIILLNYWLIKFIKMCILMLLISIRKFGVTNLNVEMQTPTKLAAQVRLPSVVTSIYEPIRMWILKNNFSFAKDSDTFLYVLSYKR